MIKIYNTDQISVDEILKREDTAAAEDNADRVAAEIIQQVRLRGDEAVLSPEWSIHSAAATHNYTFIWGMGGENLDYGDQDFSAITDLK